MTALTILAIALSVGAIALCVWTDFQHYEEDKVTNHLLEQHNEILRHMTSCMGLLEQRIKMLEQEVKKGENDGRIHRQRSNA